MEKRRSFSIPLLDFVKNSSKSDLQSDFISGLLVGIVLIPQGMAYALIAGMPPVYGLYAGTLPTILYAIFSSSRNTSVGPVALDSMLLTSGLLGYAAINSEAYIKLAILTAFLIGVTQLLLGTFRMGFITIFLSQPVISGFTSAAAIIIFVSQLKHISGLSIEAPNQLHLLIPELLSKITETNLLALGFGLGSIAILYFSKKWNPKFPISLLILLITSFLVFQFDLHERGLHIIKDIPSGFPMFEIPEMRLSDIQSLWPLAVTMAFVGYVELFSIAKGIEAKERDHTIKPNLELLALGIANIVGSFFQSFPVGGSFSRSSITVSSGARTGLANIVAATLVVIVLLFLTPFFYYLPYPVLSSIIMVSVLRLVDIEFAKRLWGTKRREALVLIITFVVTLFTGMVPGIVTGIILSTLILLFQSAYPHIAILGRLKVNNEFRNIYRFKELETWPGVLIIRIDASLSFINIQYVTDWIRNTIEKSPVEIKILLIDGGPISMIDGTACEGLKNIINYLNEKNITLLLSDLIGPVRDTLHKGGLLETVNKECIFLNLSEAIRFIETKEKGRYGEAATQYGEQYR